MRLIDADHLTKWILSWWEQTSPTSEYLKGADILAQIDREPTIDAASVVCGEWVKISGDWIDGPCGARYFPIRCSVCGYSTYDDATKFCPNCGADMRGENE